MNKINLNISPSTKEIEVNGKKVKIPKLGLRHRMLLDPGMNHEEFMKAVIKTIDKNLTQAERDFVTLHLLEYNGQIKSSVNHNGVVFNLSDVKICQKLKFTCGDYEFKFRSPTMELMSGPIDVMLNECCTQTKLNGELVDNPNFMEMPAYVYRWLEDISVTLSIESNGIEIKGLYNIMELLSEG